MSTNQRSLFFYESVLILTKKKLICKPFKTLNSFTYITFMWSSPMNALLFNEKEEMFQFFPSHLLLRDLNELWNSSCFCNLISRSRREEQPCVARMWIMFEHMRDNQMYSQSEEMERSDCSASQVVQSPVLLNILPFVS